MSTEPKCCKQKTYALAKPFRCNTYKKHGGGGAAVEFLKQNFNCMEIPTESRHPSSLQTAQRSLAISSRVLTSSSPITIKCPLVGTFLTTLPHYVITSIQRRNRVPFLPPPMQIVHRNVQVNVPAGRLDTNHQRFGVGAARQPRFVRVNFRRKHFEMKSLIVQQRHGIADHHVRHLANRFPHHLFARFNFLPRVLAR